jgi:DNA helicase HerA-like ATPase
LPSETVGTVVATISRIIFQVHFLSKRREAVPTLVVYEEAHNYISHKGRGAYGDARESAERIAKEGRKFGIGVCVVSQRPSELSETLLSQCNTFLCKRLANSVDKESYPIIIAGFHE